MIEVRALTRDEVAQRLDELAALRIAVFRDWPYLYDGDLEYERAYLTPYLHRPGALVVGALHDGRLVGASTALPMEFASHDFSLPFADRPEALTDIYYGGESLLLPLYRGRGTGALFFRHREARARALGRRYVAFCSVIRPDDHPDCPNDARGNEQFWRRSGYAPLPGVIAHFDWRDRGAVEETSHPLQFWMRTLPNA